MQTLHCSTFLSGVISLPSWFSVVTMIKVSTWENKSEIGNKGGDVHFDFKV